MITIPKFLSAGLIVSAALFFTKLFFAIFCFLGRFVFVA